MLEEDPEKRVGDRDIGSTDYDLYSIKKYKILQMTCQFVIYFFLFRIVIIMKLLGIYFLRCRKVYWEIPGLPGNTGVSRSLSINYNLFCTFLLEMYSFRENNISSSL